MASTTIRVTREYIQELPNIYSVQLAGNPQTKDDIAEQLLSASLSSPNLGSYTIDINQPQGTAVIRHNRSSHDRLTVCDHLSSLPKCLKLLQDAHVVDRKSVV